MCSLFIFYMLILMEQTVCILDQTFCVYFNKQFAYESMIILISIENTNCILDNQQCFACVESYEFRRVRSLCAILGQVLFYEAFNFFGYPSSTYSIRVGRKMATTSTIMHFSSATAPVPSVEPVERLIKC